MENGLQTSAMNKTMDMYEGGTVEGKSRKERSPSVCLRPAEAKERKEWNVRINPALLKGGNPFRKIIEATIYGVKGNNFISLAAGDPALFGPHMKVPEVASSSLIKVIQDCESNGYPGSFGLLDTRRQLADYLSVDTSHKLTALDVIMTVGAAQGIHVAFDAFRFPGCNILLPRPGFALYEGLCSYFDIEPRFYDLVEERNWEVDLDQVAALADDNTAAMLICNPGNPSGSVFKYEHLSQIATLAGALKVSIIADEVYAKMVFGDTAFVSMSMFSSIVPVLTVGSVSKSWLAPGWRLGWIGMWDPHGILKKAKIQDALLNVMQITSGPATLVQAALPQMLKSTPASFYEQTCEALKSGAEFSYNRATKIHGLDVPFRPEGSMFMMVKLDLPAFKSIKSDMEFMEVLLREESVFVVPGIAFQIPNWFRVVFALSLPQLGLAWDRIETFCSRHVHPL